LAELDAFDTRTGNLQAIIDNPKGAAMAAISGAMTRALMGSHRRRTDPNKGKTLRNEARCPMETITPASLTNTALHCDVEPGF
jgi:hypothetical protein